MSNDKITVTSTQLGTLLVNLYRIQQMWERQVDRETLYAKKVYCLGQAHKVREFRRSIEAACLGKTYPKKGENREA